MTSAVIAQRIFEVDGHEVACRFYRPEEDAGNFYCRFEIDWPEKTKAMRVGGVDEVQALLLAMQGAHANLLAARNMDGRQVKWLEDKSLGMPIAQSIRDWDAKNEM